MSHKFIPYGRQNVDADDILTVINILRGDYLTTGPAVEQFEADVCAFTGAKYAVAVSNGTAALHACMHAIGIGAGDEVIVPPITFVATSNAVLYQGGIPIFADVCAETLLIDPVAVEALITPRTKAIVGVDYAGQPCDWSALRSIADKHGLMLIADACHSLGAEYKGQKVGTLADISVFSFHPVKNMTTGEGGMAVTNDAKLAEKMRYFRGHGITSTGIEREKLGAWYYEMQGLGFNYRITDFQCALGSSQLIKLNQWIDNRNYLAKIYENAFVDTDVRPLVKHADVFHAYHLFVVKVSDRDTKFKSMREAGVGVSVHYMPVYLHTYYKSLGYKQGLCPVAEKEFENILTIPLWVGLDLELQQKIIDMLI